MTHSITISDKQYIYDPAKDAFLSAQEPEQPKAKTRLSKEDVPELEAFGEYLIDFDKSYFNSVRNLIIERWIAELFLCIECLKLGGECFVCPDAYLIFGWTPCLGTEDRCDWHNGWYSGVLNSYPTAGDFWFSTKDICDKFLRTPGVIEALNTHRMVG